MTGGEKMFWGGFAILVVVVIGVFVGYRMKHPVSIAAASTTAAITASDWTVGPRDAKVSVIEYGDFQCPACGQYETMLAQLRREYAGKVVFVFRNFPLYQVHPNAGIMAQAAEAAGTMGKYWEMHDLLFATQTTWSSSPTSETVAKYVTPYAASLGLDAAAFATALNSDGVRAKIAADVALANAAQVNHTPTFFINLKEVENPGNYAVFKALIDAALAEASAQ